MPTEVYLTNREFLFPDSGPSVPEGTKVTVLEWRGDAALCETVDGALDPGNGDRTEDVYEQSVFWAYRGDLDLWS